jgi:predicted short-subunit dehydrogenase-like oxidoreductase (DUF2520 family)
MILSIIGSGNTATTLGKMLIENNHSINEIIGRNKIEVQQLAETLHATACTEFNKTDKNSDVYIIAVKDDAVIEVANQLKLHEKIVAHTTGSVVMNVLKNTSENYGVLYPLQSLRKELNYTPVIPFLVDGNNDVTKKTIFNLACSISKSVFIADDETRLKYHLSAVILSNFTNHLFTLTKDYCDKNNIDFNFLFPLIEETVNRLHEHEPSSMQTGPAIRGDDATMQKHLQLLDSFTDLKNIYEIMSESIRHSSS